jgi:hypothetical protein
MVTGEKHTVESLISRYMSHDDAEDRGSALRVDQIAEMTSDCFVLGYFSGTKVIRELLVQRLLVRSHQPFGMQYGGRQRWPSFVHLANE